MGSRARAWVTGANGFIGRALMARLQAMGVATGGVDLVADATRNVVAGDISRPGPWQSQARGCEIVFHTAAVVSNTAAPALYRAISVAGVRNVIDAAIQGGASRFIHLSSIAAYGLDLDTDRHEGDPITALSGFPYCDAKAAGEHPVLAAHAAGEIAATVIRPGDVYGPGSRPWVLIPLAMMRKHQFLLPAQGRGIFSPVYIDNLLDGILLAAENPPAAGQVFNMTDGSGVECREFFSHHHRWLGRRGAPLALPTPLAAGVTGAAGWLLRRLLKQQTEISMASLAMLSRRATYSIAKARRMLGYSPTIGLGEGMQRTKKWLRDNGMI